MSIIEDRKGKEYDAFTNSYVEKPATSKPLPEVELGDAVYGEAWQEIVERAVYAPTRYEYFAGLALQGLVVGRAERDIKTAVRNAMSLAYEMEALLDKEKG